MWPDPDGLEPQFFQPPAGLIVRFADHDGITVERAVPRGRAGN